LEEESSEEGQSFADMFEDSVKDNCKQELRSLFQKVLNENFKNFALKTFTGCIWYYVMNKETRMSTRPQYFRKKSSATYNDVRT